MSGTVRRPGGAAAAALGVLASLAGVLASLAGALGAAAPATAAPPAIVAVEQAVETSARDLALPAGGVGVISLRPCTGCRPVSLLAGTATRWIVAGEALPFAEFSRLLAGRPATAVVVLYRGGSGEITRVIAQLPPARLRP